MAENVITVDGSYLEGGGQILRNSGALSCINQIPVKIVNIRAGRSNPGLRPQHLMGLQLMRDMTDGKLDNAEVSSTEVTLFPKNLKQGHYIADTKTAGSICLLIQAALPCQFFASGPTSLVLKGGTNAEMAPQIDYFLQVFQPMLSKFGIEFQCEVVRRGYYPKGGGEAVINCQPVMSIPPFILTDPGDWLKITGRSFAAGVLPIKVANTMAQVAKNVLMQELGRDAMPIDIEVVKEPEDKSFGTGTGIILVAETTTGCRFAGSALGKKGVPAEKVGQNAAEELLNEMNTNGCVDKYLQDQLIILMALANGKSQVNCGPITDHTKTGIHVAQLLTKAKFEVKNIDPTTWQIECDGIGLKNRYL